MCLEDSSANLSVLLAVVPYTVCIILGILNHSQLPLGGANEAVIRMLIAIGTPDKVPEFIEQVKRREKVLSGFGHRVYKTTDPRSYIIRKTADEVFKVYADMIRTTEVTGC